MARGLNKPCAILIVIGGMERFAFKGVASNLVTYLTDVVKMSNSAAAKAVNSWSGITSMLPLLTAPLADSYWDRYITIVASSSLYIVGLVALTSTAMDLPWISSTKTTSFASLSWSLYLISLGSAAYNPSLQAFAAEQQEEVDDAGLPCTKNNGQSPPKKTLFFQWWYFGICCGSLLGTSMMSYIQDTIGWGVGFAIPAIAMIISLVFFLCGNKFYTRKKIHALDLKSLGNLVQTLREKVSQLFKGNATMMNRVVVDELELEERPLCSPEDGSSKDIIEESDQEGIYLLQIAKVVLPLLPVWTMLLMFAVIFQQPITFFTKQGMVMKRNIGSHFKIPPAALQSAITVSIILLMPLYDKLFIPFIRIFTRSEKGINVMQRMGVGMFLSVIAMIIAALTERKRLTMNTPLNIFCLLPQYILLGISDIFTVVGMQEFFYSEVPIRMRTMGIALYTSVFGVGSFVSVLLISSVEYFTSSSESEHGWFADDMKVARLDNYYWLLSVLSAVSFVSFVIFCRFYTSRS
ncbi:transporter [Lithospermum erythrorhizon]|uniref:Transporter n=1 Tax=Lithospermum erythrorhizon TaxID=34254 RepID=A0AAV3NM65_LITER